MEEADRVKDFRRLWPDGNDTLLCDALPVDAAETGYDGPVCAQATIYAYLMRMGMKQRPA